MRSFVSRLSIRPTTRKTVTLGVLFAALASACDSQPELVLTAKPVTATEAAAPQGKPANAEAYGEKITAGLSVPLAKVLSAPATFAGKTLIVEGEVRKACSRKGCWMEVGTTKDADAPGCRVTFKDYGFFVPTNSAGAKAKLSGTVEVETIEAGQVQHMEEEGAKFTNKQADGRAQEVRFVATGVELTKS